MDLTLVFDIVLGVLLLLFALGGARRGLLPEAVAMAGILLGALLTEQWADAWGTDLSEMLPIDSTAARFLVRLLLFLIPTVVIGYFGALLLPKTGKLDLRTRIFGALVGLLNGAAIVGFLLRAFQYTFNRSDPNSQLMVSTVGRILLEWAGWWVLVMAIGGSIAVIAALLVRGGRTKPALKPVPIATGPTIATPTTAGSLTANTATPAPLIGSSLDRPLSPVTTTVTPLQRPATSSSNLDSPLRLPGSDSGSRPSDPTAVVPVVSASGSTSTSAPPRTETVRPLQRCRTCGKELLPGAAFCTNCGTPVE